MAKQMKVTPLKVKEDRGILYMHQILQTPVGVAQIQVAVNKEKLRGALKGLAQRAGVQFSGAQDKKVTDAAGVLALKGALDLADMCGGLPRASLTRTLAQAAQKEARNYETDVELNEDEEEDADDDEDPDGADGLFRRRRRPRPAVKKHKPPPPPPEDDDESQEDEDAPPAAAGDFTQASPDDTNPPSTQPVDVQPSYVDLGPSTPNA
jgi:hypothetical protein